MLFFNANFICYYFYPTKKREEPNFICYYFYPTKKREEPKNTKKLKLGLVLV